MDKPPPFLLNLGLCVKKTTAEMTKSYIQAFIDHFFGLALKVLTLYDMLDFIVFYDFNSNPLTVLSKNQTTQRGN